MMMKDRMRELNIKMTELSDYMKVSRPTLYKYIDSYENGNLSGIPERVTGLFRLIDSPGSTKEQAVSFAISAFSNEGDDAYDRIRRYLSDPSSSPSKVELIDRLISTSCLDDLIPYLNGCMDILSKDVMTDDDIRQIARFVIMRYKVTRNVPVKDEEFDEAAGLMRR